jgi:hypothetical protein
MTEKKKHIDFAFTIFLPPALPAKKALYLLCLKVPLYMTDDGHFKSKKVYSIIWYYGGGRIQI